MSWILQCNLVLQGMPARALPSSLEHRGSHLKTSKHLVAVQCRLTQRFFPQSATTDCQTEQVTALELGLGGQSLFPFPQFPSGCSLGVPGGSARCPGGELAPAQLAHGWGHGGVKTACLDATWCARCAQLQPGHLVPCLCFVCCM